MTAAGKQGRGVFRRSREAFGEWRQQKFGSRSLGRAALRVAGIATAGELAAQAEQFAAHTAALRGELAAQAKQFAAHNGALRDELAVQGEVMHQFATNNATVPGELERARENVIHLRRVEDSYAAAQDAYVIGAPGAMTGPASANFAPVLEAMKAYLDNLNAKGGVNGKPVQMIVMDDSGEPSKAAANAKQLIAQDPVPNLVPKSRASTHAPRCTARRCASSALTNARARSATMCSVTAAPRWCSGCRGFLPGRARAAVPDAADRRRRPWPGWLAVRRR